MQFTKNLVIKGCIFSLMAASVGFSQTTPVRLDKQKYIDKCKGAWAGQMIGVCFGAEYEFKSNGQIYEGEIKPWAPERIKGAIGQDDCYVEMTFLAALEKHGLDITYEQAGKAFGETKFGLWHANAHGRSNVQVGIMPPMSGHPLYNNHADDIDFQIEADLLGVICPGMPQESNRLGDIFGHIMNYGDGVYGGLFVAGMYTAAYFEDNDVQKVLQVGLDCIPPESQYHQCISDVVRWHKENPDNWRATWKKIEDKWNDDIDCAPGNPFNIDAKINGAYIAMGLLYGNGDFLKTMEISTRCGQDADCNPSSAAGVLGGMKGYEALGKHYTGGIPTIEGQKFSHTDYSFKTLIPACLRMAEKIVTRAGGKVTEDALMIPQQTPKPPCTLEQWIHQKEMLAVPITQYELNLWNPAWKVLACAVPGNAGYLHEMLGRQGVLRLEPFKDSPAVIAADLEVPGSGQPTLNIDLASERREGFALKVFINDKLVKESVINTRGKWTTESVDMTPYAGKTVNVRIETSYIEGRRERIFLNKVEIK